MRAIDGILSAARPLHRRLMTPVPRGLPRTLGFVVLLVALALPGVALAEEVPALPEEAPTCNGMEAIAPSDATEGGDVIVGTDGDDIIYGRGGDDLICAGDGDDVVVGGLGNDQVSGGRGNDCLMGGLGSDAIFGEAGVDVISGDAGRDTLSGGDDRDVVLGGSGNDTLNGDGGNDKLVGEAGFDRLFGGDGGDELEGGLDDDRLFGDAGNDYLWGDDGDDLLIAGAGDDLLQGGLGADDLQGQGGFDELWGGECSLKPVPDGVVDCREVPSGRPDGDPTVDPDDTFNGGPGIDACNKSPNLAEGCDTRRGERPGSPWDPAAAGEWWDEIILAFEERAVFILENPDDYEDPEGLAQAVVDEIGHAKQIAACESMGDPFQMTPSATLNYPSATVDGLFQHKSVYWAARSEDAGYPGASVFDPLANARVAAWMVAVDIEVYWSYSDRLTKRRAWTDWACDEALVTRGVWATP
jgi:hypothetical protein